MLRSCRSQKERGSVSTSSAVSSEPEAWARCIAPATPSSAAKWRSRFCRILRPRSRKARSFRAGSESSRVSEPPRHRDPAEDKGSGRGHRRSRIRRYTSRRWATPTTYTTTSVTAPRRRFGNPRVECGRRSRALADVQRPRGLGLRRGHRWSPCPVANLGRELPELLGDGRVKKDLIRRLGSLPTRPTDRVDAPRSKPDLPHLPTTVRSPPERRPVL